jgi:hypothetical protein
MDNKMEISEKILLEITKYNKINRYISEQEVGAELPPAEELPAVEPGAPEIPDGETPPADAGLPTGTTPEVIDVEKDEEVEKIDDTNQTEEGSEELEITDLVKSQKNIEDKQEEYFNNLFNQISTLESKLGEMDSVIQKLNDIEAKIEKYREKTPQEKLELRSLDSGPYNQKLSDFFDDKQDDLEKSGKNEYILTVDDVEDFSPNEIKDTFNNYAEEDEFKPLKY